MRTEKPDETSSVRNEPIRSPTRSFLGPYDPALSNVDLPDHPPSHIHFVDAEGHFHGRPFIYESVLTDIARRTYVENTSVRYPIQLFVKGEPFKLWWIFNSSLHLF